MTKHVTVPTVGAGPVTLTIEDGKGVVDDNASRAFTNGQCHSFAIAMHDMTEWPIIGIGYSDDDPWHFVVYSPKLDSFVDINGPGAENRYPNLFRNSVVEYNREDAIRPPAYYKANPKAAIPFVKTVLEEVDQQREKKEKKNGYMYLGKVF